MLMQSLFSLETYFWHSFIYFLRKLSRFSFKLLPSLLSCLWQLCLEMEYYTHFSVAVTNLSGSHCKRSSFVMFMLCNLNLATQVAQMEWISAVLSWMFMGAHSIQQYIMQETNKVRPVSWRRRQFIPYETNHKVSLDYDLDSKTSQAHFFCSSLLKKEYYY